MYFEKNCNLKKSVNMKGYTIRIIILIPVDLKPFNKSWTIILTRIPTLYNIGQEHSRNKVVMQC